MSTDSQAYVLAETVFSVGVRRMDQRDVSQRGASGGETLIGLPAVLGNSRATWHARK